MYTCDTGQNKVCNVVREPVCLRGGRYTAASVTGTGPGSICREEEPETPPEPVTPLPGCVLTFKFGGQVFNRASNGKISAKVC